MITVVVDEELEEKLYRLYYNDTEYVFYVSFIENLLSGVISEAFFNNNGAVLDILTFESEEKYTYFKLKYG